MLTTLLKPLLRLLLPTVLGLVSDAAISWVTGFACPITSTSVWYTLVCGNLWSHVTGMVVASLTYLRTHPNGLLGDAVETPDLAARALSKVKLAPAIEPTQVLDQGTTTYDPTKATG